MISSALHFIAIGGRIMHSLAIAMHQQGHTVTGSDDEIYDPALEHLAETELLPVEMGWFPEKIHPQLTAVLVGMHARPDNPELAQAREMGLLVYSYPEYVFQQSAQKQRIVIAGSHGKTTITALIMHVLKYHNRSFDYLIGAPVDGFDSLVRLTDDAPIIIIEGDEYPSSPIDPTPKFLHYQPHIALISGVAWDHVNIYPTWEVYVDQFENLAESMPKAGVLAFDETDNMLDVIGQKERPDVTKIPYEAHPYRIADGQTWLITQENKEVPVLLFGEHNMKNISGAQAICDRLGITDAMFYEAVGSFKGATRRIEKLAGPRLIFRDFAHAPAKVEATTDAVKAQFPGRQLLVVVELRTFSSLNKTFLSQYKDRLDGADVAVVYFNAHTLTTHRLEQILPEEVKLAFDRPDLHVFTETAELEDFILSQRTKVDAFLLMSSGTFGGLDITKLAAELS